MWEMGNWLPSTMKIWSGDGALRAISPDIYLMVGKRAQSYTVAEALHNNQWIANFRGQLAIPALVQYLMICRSAAN
jgi:hypothetical protein